MVSDFNVLSLLTVPSRFSDPPREAVGSWSYLSIKAKVSSQRLSLSSGVSRRCLYLGPTNGDALILPQAVVSIQLVTWTAEYYYSLCAAAAKSPQSCPTLCDPIDGSPPGSSVPGILQAKTLGWVAISFSNA